MNVSELRTRVKGPRWWRHVASGAMFPAIFVATTMAIGGMTDGFALSERIFRTFILPCGLIWLGLMGLASYCVLQKLRWLAMFAGLLFVTFGLLGSDTFSLWLCETLEGQFDVVDPKSFEKCDVLVVFGGGVKTLPGNKVLLGSRAGDRIILGCRLFHAGKANKLVFTGSNHVWLKNVMNQADAAKQIAIELKVPEERIEVCEGRNTSEELRNLKQRFGGQPNLRIGVVSSATHLPRILRLAKSVHLNVIPVPSDFERDVRLPWTLGILPAASGFRRAERVAIEYLAMLVGR